MSEQIDANMVLWMCGWQHQRCEFASTRAAAAKTRRNTCKAAAAPCNSASSPITVCAVDLWMTPVSACNPAVSLGVQVVQSRHHHDQDSAAANFWVRASDVQNVMLSCFFSPAQLPCRAAAPP